MEVSKAIILAARALAEQINAAPQMQALREAESALQAEDTIRGLESEVLALYDDLVSRQRAGEILDAQEINRFYNLRDRLARHPVVACRDAAAEQVKSLLQGAGSAISSILTLDYTALVLENNGE